MTKNATQHNNTQYSFSYA